MKKETVWRDGNGVVQHIGDLTKKKSKLLGENVTSSIEDVTTSDDGARIVATDYKKLRKNEYPSVEDQLDYIFHNGVDAWKNNMIAPIKNKYPKS